MKKQDLIGQRFGRLVVIEKDHEAKRPSYLCKCDCGEMCVVRADGLKNGHTQSCGCFKRERQSESNKKDIAPGAVFSRYTVIKNTGKKSARSGSYLYLCKCECGTEKVVSGSNLRTGRVLSCGCLRNERQKAAVQTHGGYRSRLYHIWDAMIQRSTNSNHPSYKYYGGRGITVCEEWRNSFESFRVWALDAGYDENAEKWECTLDRIDTNSGYFPSNCRWVSQKEQMNNTRRCNVVVVNGVGKNLTQWAQELGIKRHQLYKKKSNGTNMSEFISSILNNKE